MTNELQIALEVGPKGKKVVAVAPDWPGLSRGAKTGELALERLMTYLPRYAPVAALAGMEAAFTAQTNAQVVEEYPGTGSTDFWGISFAHSSFDKAVMSPDDLERKLALMQASWTFFDTVRARVSEELQKGPRGGGRDRDQIVRHVLSNEADWAAGVGVDLPREEIMTDDGLVAHRAAYCAAIREAHAAGRQAKTWPLHFLIRHTAYHTLDHAWEMEDKDLSSPPSS
jgi:hypothetical protein